MKKYFKTNRKVLDFINSGKYIIHEIRPIKRKKKHGLIITTYISSYCVLYDKMV